MNYLRKISENFIKKVFLVSLISDQELEITPKLGYFSEDEDNNLNITYDNVYFTANSAYLSQSGKTTTSGYVFEKEFGLQFPLSEIAVEVLNRFKYLKAIKIQYCDGKIVNITRNDIVLNNPIAGESKIEGKFLKIAWSQQSIFSFSFQ